MSNETDCSLYLWKKKRLYQLGNVLCFFIAYVYLHNCWRQLEWEKFTFMGTWQSSQFTQAQSIQQRSHQAEAYSHGLFIMQWA